MRRALICLLGLVLVAAMGGTGSAQARAAQQTQFEVARVIEEGPPRAAGRSFSFLAALLDEDQRPVVGVPVTLLARGYGEADFSPVAETSTDEYGNVRAEAVLHRTSAVRWSFAGNSDYAASMSIPYSQNVGSRVTADAVDRTVARHRRVIVVGTSKPTKPGSRVSLWRGDKPAFMPGLQMARVAVGVVRANGTFRLSARFAGPGAKRLYVKVNAGHGTATGYSPYIRVRVR